jgi:hypothetical protein
MTLVEALSRVRFYHGTTLFETLGSGAVWYSLCVPDTVRGDSEAASGSLSFAGKSFSQWMEELRQGCPPS